VNERRRRLTIFYQPLIATHIMLSNLIRNLREHTVLREINQPQWPEFRATARFGLRRLDASMDPPHAALCSQFDLIVIQHPRVRQPTPRVQQSQLHRTKLPPSPHSFH
jgi:hypothetical protein